MEKNKGRTGAPSGDLALVRKILEGDESAFASLVERYHGRLVRLALVYVRDQADAEEVVQETWLGVLRGLKEFEGRSTLRTWIFRILTNQAKTRGVRDGRMTPFSALGESDATDDPAVDPSRFTSKGMWADPPRPWNDDTPEKILLREEAVGVLNRAIAGLPPNQQAVVTLRDAEGLSSEEVCNVLDISETNQRVLLHRARSKLRRFMEEFLKGR